MHYDKVVKMQELYLANIYGAYNTPTHMLPQAMYFCHNVIQMEPKKKKLCQQLTNSKMLLIIFLRLVCTQLNLI